MERDGARVMMQGDSVPGSQGRRVGSSGRRIGTALVGLALAAVSLSACAAGPRAQTANQYSVVDGAIGNVGAIAIRNAGVAAPSTPAGYTAGATVQLSAQIVSNSINADQLVSVTSPAAKSVALVTAAESASGIAVSPSPTPTAAAQSAPIDIPGNTIVTIGAAQSPSISLQGLDLPLASGQTIPVTFTFRTAGALTLQLPVKLVPDSTGGETVDVSPTGN